MNRSTHAGQEIRIRYPDLAEFECDGLSDLVRMYPHVRHCLLAIRSIKVNKHDRADKANIVARRF
jgi:hypothetical protein